ncbi:MAG TPA: SCO1664 family protein [Patescibacteria group bacterium]|nr:SCO1664 family protein [Patescibacteria group bacterium]
MTNDATMVAMLNTLEQGEVAMEGLVPWGSNYTFLVRVRFSDIEAEAIYKPGKGERPLWDFTRGTLCLRERAAYLTSEALNWGLVPPTILREGPHGWGSFQYFVDHDPQQHYLTIQGKYPLQVQRIAFLDALINNADRKSGHVLIGEGDRLWAIDHGVCFHQEYKLRSVIWEYAGELIPKTLIDDAIAFHDWLCYRNTPEYVELSQLLDSVEMDALLERLEQLIKRGTFPVPGPGRPYPWPLV